ncbi:hypothetical protein EB796_022626 [Bugula neritina]|uniref:Uncharacterized protein n=1 Tax=Bugula neritina TaxID=10212 RepID=A0A7J7J070_BUGNE|nr:hypothetical protein EB796_022626 [Bugula neritina]
MVLHPNQFCVASGQASGTSRQETAAHIRIWDARSLVTYAILGFGIFHVAVGSLAFSVESDGQYLLAIDESEKHVLSVWAWQEEQLVVKSSTTTDTVVWGTFHPLDDRIIITYGKQHIFFWKIFYDSSSPTRILRDKLSGIFQGEVPKFVTSVCFTPDGDVLSGDSNGNITLWSQDNSGAFSVSKRQTSNMRQAHRKSVFCLHMFSDGTFVSGGGHEIKKWDRQYKCKETKKLPEQYGFVRTLIPAKEDLVNSGLYVGTTKNCLLDGNWNEKFRVVIVGHSEELWALSSHPQEHTFVTAGYDHSVCKWSAVSHKLIWKIVIEKPCLSVCHNNTGDLLVIGTTEGQFMVMDANDGSHVATIQVGHGAVDSTKFSPDGRLLAMGAQDGNIYIYSVADGGHFFRKYRDGSLKGHKNFVMQIDWSEDSEYIQSVSGDYDLMFWNIYEMRREQDPAVIRDISWATQSCVLGYSTAGAWTHLEDDGEDINIVCKSSYEDYLAVGDNQGALRIFKYPTSASQPDFYEKKVYSSHVTNVKFMFDDSYLLSTGGIDAGLMQWVLVDSKTPR